MNDNPSQNFPITIIQGATYVQNFTWYDTSGNVVNLTGYTGQMNFASTVEDTESIFELSTSSGSIVINGTSGTIIVTISSTTTSALSNGQQMVYNLFLTSPTGIVVPLLAGKAYVQGSTI